LILSKDGSSTKGIVTFSEDDETFFEEDETFSEDDENFFEEDETFPEDDETFFEEDETFSEDDETFFEEDSFFTEEELSSDEDEDSGSKELDVEESSPHAQKITDAAKRTKPFLNMFIISTLKSFKENSYIYAHRQ